MTLTKSSSPRRTTPAGLTATLLADIASSAHRIDIGETTTRQALTDLAAAGLIDIGAPSGRGTVLEQAAVIEAWAEKSLSVAFSVWCHRMTQEYLSIVDGNGLEAMVEDLRSGVQVGSSAMADAFRYSAGIGELPLVLHRDSAGQLRLSGRLPWASNLFDDAIVFTAAQGPSGAPVIVAFPLAAPGVSIGPELELLALRGTASTSVTLDNVVLPDDHVLTTDFSAFIRRARPVLSLLQASFCLGLAGESYRHTKTQLTGVNEVFRADLTQFGERLKQAQEQFVLLASCIGTAESPAGQAVLALRLEAGLLAKELTRLETMTAGSRAFVVTSDVNRRYREVMFIPLQAPSEAQLRAELAHKPGV